MSCSTSSDARLRLAAVLVCAAACGCEAVVGNQAIDARLATNLSGPWVADTAQGPLYLFLVEKGGEVWGGVVHSIPGTAVSYVYGSHSGSTLTLQSHDVKILASSCQTETDCCAEVPLGGRAFCYCDDSHTCRMRRVCFGNAADCQGHFASPPLAGTVGLYPGDARMAAITFDAATVTYVLGRAATNVQSGSLSFRRLPEYYDAFFPSGALPGSADANSDFDCEGQGQDSKPDDPDADNDGIPDGCVEFASQLGLVPAGAVDVLESYDCGNHHLEAGESCDDWLTGDDAAVCNACRPSKCGDGVVEPPEECDDGNSVDDDDCSNDCHKTTRCGDGYVHKSGTPPFEQCDEGAYNAPGGTDFSHHCLPNCIQARCGDGYVDETSETCDLGGANDDAGDCTTTCHWASCGDGKLHTVSQGHTEADGIEECDDGNVDDHDSCLSTCVTARCGDGITNCPPGANGCTAEACDDGNNVSGDGCNASCSLVDSEDFSCNHITPLDQTAPTVGVQPGGAFIIAWEDKSEFPPDVSAQSIRARMFAPDGGPRINPNSGDVFEFVVNTTTPRAQKSPSIGVSQADGRFVVVFEDQSELGSCSAGGFPYTAVRARLFAADGSPIVAPLAGVDPNGDWEVVPSVGSPLHPPADMTNPQIAWSPSGGRFLVVWESSATPCPPTRGWADVHGRMFDSGGNPLAPEFVINSTDLTPGGMPADQGQPEAAFFADGSFVVVWQDASGQAPDASGAAVRARLFTSDPRGIPRTNAVTGDAGDFVVPTTTEEDQGQPLVATQPGGFVVVWSDASQKGHDTDILAVRARLFSTGGAPLATPLSSHWTCGTTTSDPCCAASTCDFQVNTTESGLQQAFSVASGVDGNFIIAFIDQSQQGADESSTSIRARAFYGDGTPRPTRYGLGGFPGSTAATDDFVVNTRTQYSQFSPVVASRADGSAVVAFADNSALGPDTFPWGIRARILFHVLGGP